MGKAGSLYCKYKKKAQAIYHLLEDDGVYYLSTDEKQYTEEMRVNLDVDVGMALFV